MSVFAGVGVLVPLLEYLRPSKSPYLITAVSGMGALMTATQFLADEPVERGLALCAPFYIILPVITLMSCYSKFEVSDDIEHNRREVEHQLKFARAISISAAMFCLVGSGAVLEFRELAFYLFYFACITHMFIFLVYMAFRSVREEKVLRFNFFQFSFITTGYLFAAGSCFALAEEKDDVYLSTAYFFYVLWGFCEIYWVDKIFSVSRYSKLFRLGKIRLSGNPLRSPRLKKLALAAVLVLLAVYGLNIITEHRTYYHLSRFKGSLFYNTEFSSLYNLPCQTERNIYLLQREYNSKDSVIVESAGRFSLFPKELLSGSQKGSMDYGPLKCWCDVVCSADGRYLALVNGGWFVDLYDFQTDTRKSLDFELSNWLENEQVEKLNEYHQSVIGILGEDPKSLYADR